MATEYGEPNNVDLFSVLPSSWFKRSAALLLADNEATHIYVQSELTASEALIVQAHCVFYLNRHRPKYGQIIGALVNLDPPIVLAQLTYDVREGTLSIEIPTRLAGEALLKG